MHISENPHVVYREGLIHKWIHTMLSPLMSVNNSQFCSIHTTIVQHGCRCQQEFIKISNYKDSEMLNTFKLTTSKQLMKPKKSINLDSRFVKYRVACHLIYLSILQVACHSIVIHSYFEQWFYWSVFCQRFCFFSG